MNELSKRLADLSPEKQTLLVQALQNSGTLNAFPLSFAQQGAAPQSSPTRIVK